jgi:hypothetical protein
MKASGLAIPDGVAVLIDLFLRKKRGLERKKQDNKD